jgi:hypothetical protein
MCGLHRRLSRATAITALCRGRRLWRQPDLSRADGVLRETEVIVVCYRKSTTEARRTTKKPAASLIRLDDNLCASVVKISSYAAFGSRARSTASASRSITRR